MIIEPPERCPWCFARITDRLDREQRTQRPVWTCGASFCEFRDWLEGILDEAVIDAITDPDVAGGEYGA
jgi:hypothetical protein